MSSETALVATVNAALSRASRRPLVVGLCGAQGSGKSTLAAALVHHFAGAATLSLDDIYLTRAQRQMLAHDIHPLFATRGVPGTHDVALGLDVIAALDDGRPVRLPRFDKSTDDRASPDTFPLVAATCPLLILEGWCVGARPQRREALASPINPLEEREDPEGRWRTYANEALGGRYQDLFKRVDLLVLLAAPSFETVLAWRLQQEHALRASGARGVGVMDDAAVERFVQHYERLTRHILEEMPGRADMVLRFDAERTCTAIEIHGAFKAG